MNPYGPFGRHGTDQAEMPIGFRGISDESCVRPAHWGHPHNLCRKPQSDWISICPNKVSLECRIGRKKSKRSLPTAADNQLIDRQAIKIEGNVKSGDEGISKQMITAFGKYRIEDFQDTIDPGNTQNGGIKFKSIVAKAGEPWSGLDQKPTGE